MKEQTDSDYAYNSIKRANFQIIFSQFSQIDCVHYMSKKGKSPWISYNEDDVADSHFCIEYLNQKFSELCFYYMTNNHVFRKCNVM